MLRFSCGVLAATAGLAVIELYEDEAKGWALLAVLGLAALVAASAYTAALAATGAAKRPNGTDNGRSVPEP